MSGSGTFKATVRPSLRSVARYTAAILVRETGASMRYESIWSPIFKIFRGLAIVAPECKCSLSYIGFRISIAT